MRRTVILTVLALAIPVLAFAQTPARLAAEKAVREADAALAQAVASKNIDECLALFDAEAAIPGAGGTAYRSKDPKAFRAVWERNFSTPGFNLKWNVDNVIVLESGTLAHSSGTYDSGLANGTFFAVWRKQSDGKWKVLVDAPWEVPAGKR